MVWWKSRGWVGQIIQKLGVDPPLVSLVPPQYNGGLHRVIENGRASRRTSKAKCGGDYELGALEMDKTIRSLVR